MLDEEAKRNILSTNKDTVPRKTEIDAHINKEFLSKSDVNNLSPGRDDSLGSFSYNDVKNHNSAVSERSSKPNIAKEENKSEFHLNNLNISGHKNMSNSYTSQSELSLNVKSSDTENRKQVYIKTKFKPNLMEFISNQLKDVIFSGWMGEREYTESLSSYRDIIEIDEWESSLVNKLKIIMRNVKGVLEGTRWINITGKKINSFN